MPAYCSTSFAYETYCELCIKMHREPPTREWWDNSCNQPRPVERRLSDDEFDDEVEQRDGWAR